MSDQTPRVSLVVPEEPMPFALGMGKTMCNPSISTDPEHTYDDDKLSNVFVMNQGHFNAVVAHAIRIGKLVDPPKANLRSSLVNWLKYLDGYGRHNAVVLNGPDGPYGFSVTCYGWSTKAGAWMVRWYGGLLYYGDDDNGVAGPNFSVRLGELSKGWSLHT